MNIRLPSKLITCFQYLNASCSEFILFQNLRTFYFAFNHSIKIVTNSDVYAWTYINNLV